SMHQRHSPHVRMEPRNTRSPFATPGGRTASGPTSWSTPTGSWPSTHGAGARGSPLKNVLASVPQMPQASTRRIAPRGSSLGSSVSRISTEFTSVMNAALIALALPTPARSSRCPSPSELLGERVVGLVGAPPLADHARERARDRLGRRGHEDVPPDRAPDRAGLDRHLHPPEQLLVLQPRAAREHDGDAVRGIRELGERLGIARPVGLHDVGAELGTQPHVPAQVLEPILLL